MIKRFLAIYSAVFCLLFFLSSAIIYRKLENAVHPSAGDGFRGSPVIRLERSKTSSLSRSPGGGKQDFPRRKWGLHVMRSTSWSRRYDLLREPLTSSYYTTCWLQNASGGSRFGLFRAERVPFKSYLHITDNRPLAKISSLARVDRLNVARRAIPISDKDFLRKVAHSTVTSNLFDAEDEDYLAPFWHYFVLRPYLVNHYVPSFLIGQDIGCYTNRSDSRPETDWGRGAPFLLAVVFTEHTDFMQREAIRKTWGQVESNWANDPEQDSYRIKLVFVLGYREEFSNTKLQKEAAAKRDIVQANFIDTYRNLSLKMVSALYWAREYCPGVQHVLKVDSDTFVNMMLLTSVLTALPTMAHSAPGHRWMLGHVNPKPVVIKTGVEYGRWKVDNDLYPFDQFPTYLYGHSYVISGCVIEDLLRAYHRMPLIPVEDAYFTGVLAKALGIRRIHSPWFATYFKHLPDFSISSPGLLMEVTMTNFEDWTNQLQFYLTFIAKYIHMIRY